MIWIGAASVPSLYLRNFFCPFLSSCEVRHFSEKGHGHLLWKSEKAFFAGIIYIIHQLHLQKCKIKLDSEVILDSFFFSLDRLLFWFLHEKYCGRWRVTMPRRKQQEPRRSAGKLPDDSHLTKPSQKYFVFVSSWQFIFLFINTNCSCLVGLFCKHSENYAENRNLKYFLV